MPLKMNRMHRQMNASEQSRLGAMGARNAQAAWELKAIQVMN